MHRWLFVSEVNNLMLVCRLIYLQFFFNKITYKQTIGYLYLAIFEWRERVSWQIPIRLPRPDGLDQLHDGAREFGGARQRRHGRRGAARTTPGLWHVLILYLKANILKMYKEFYLKSPIDGLYVLYFNYTLFYYLL